MDVAGEGPDRSSAPDRVPIRRAPWATGGRLAVAVTSLVVAVVVAGVALRSVGVDLGGPVAVEAGASAEGGDDLHRIEPVAVSVAIGPTTTDAPDPAAPAVPPSVDGGTGGLAAAPASSPVAGTSTSPGAPTTTVAGGLLPGVTVAPPVTDLTDPVVGVLPAPLDTVVDSVLEPVDPLLEPVDPLLEPLDPLLGGLLSPTTTAPAGQG